MWWGGSSLLWWYIPRSCVCMFVCCVDGNGKNVVKLSGCLWTTVATRSWTCFPLHACSVSLWYLFLPPQLAVLVLSQSCSSSYLVRFTLTYRTIRLLYMIMIYMPISASASQTSAQDVSIIPVGLLTLKLSGTGSSEPIMRSPTLLEAMTIASMEKAGILDACI